MSLRDAIAARFPGDAGRIPELRDRLVEICQRFLDVGLGDANALQNLTSTNVTRYTQQLSEVLLAAQMTGKGLQLRHWPVGPDFFVENDGQGVWVEVITPEPQGIPLDWLRSEPGATNVPHEAILLRWTAAIKEKTEKLIGGPRGPGYLASGVVGAGEPYVIAINSRLLRGREGMLTAFDGISLYPAAVEAVFALGPLGVRINRDTLETSEPEHQHRPVIRKANGAAVPASMFLDPRFAPISAIWAVDIGEGAVLGPPERSAVVHNPLANNPLPVGLLPAFEEYQAEELNADSYQLKRAAM